MSARVTANLPVSLYFPYPNPNYSLCHTLIVAERCEIEHTMSEPCIPKDVIASLRDAMESYKSCGGILYESWHRHELPDEERWIPWSIANELRYVGQHICRLLCYEGVEERQTEIDRAKGHCERAKYDAHDYLILFFTRYILNLLKTMEKYAIEVGNVYECNHAKKEFIEICRAIATNERKNCDFIACRSENIASMAGLFDALMGHNAFRPKAEEEPTHKLLVGRDFVMSGSHGASEKEMREVFNRAEAYLKKYELVSGEVSILGINRLFEATCCLVDNDCQTFMERCHLAQVDTLMEIVAYFCDALGEVRRPEEILEALQGRSADEKIEYLEGEITGFEGQWCGG